MAEPLSIAFEDAEELEREPAQNLSKGGAVVRTNAEPELRSIVEVELQARFASKRWVFEAEVVALIPGVGVAVQFVKPAEELREEFGDLLEPPAGDRDSSAGASESGDVDALPREETGFADEVEDLGAEYELDDLDPDALCGEDQGHTQLEPAPTPTVEPDPAPEVPPSPTSDPLADVQDRRRAHRSPARVPARIDAPNVSVAGRTRDISETGLLLSADGSELPVGKVVRLEIRHPGTGEPFVVRGKVARHLRGDGTVAAVAVVFDPEPEQEDELAAVVRAVKATEDQRVARGIGGQIEELGMMNLIQMMGNSSPEGTLTASSGEEEGVIAFAEGALRYARLGSMKGIKALVRMLGWSDGHFEFHSQVDALDDEDEPIPLPTALLEAARQMDEAGAQGLPVLPPGVTFTVDTDALARSGGLDKTAEAVVELAMASFTVRRILDVIPEPDAEIRGAIEALVESGILDPRPA
jgi:hypothetical protein